MYSDPELRKHGESLEKCQREERDILAKLTHAEQEHTRAENTLQARFDSEVSALRKKLEDVRSQEAVQRGLINAREQALEIERKKDKESKK